MTKQTAKKPVKLKPHWWYPPKVKARDMPYQEGLDTVRSIKVKSAWEEKRQIVRQKDKRHTHNVQAILNAVERNVGPPWYQELSPQQMDAADHLICSMRDDWYEDEIYRTMNILTTLGVCPHARRSAIRDAICRSFRRPVDFLLLMFKSFRGRDPLVLQKDYTVNERLMLSAIAHLCLYQTLRELDRRLPPPLPPREQPEDTLSCLMQKAHYQSAERVERPDDDPILQRNPCAKYREYLEVPSWPVVPKSVFYKPFNLKQPSLAPYDKPRCPGLKDHRPDLGQKKRRPTDCLCYDEKYAEAGGEEGDEKGRKKIDGKGKKGGKGPKGGGRRGPSGRGGRGGMSGGRGTRSKKYSKDEETMHVEKVGKLHELRRGSGVAYMKKEDHTEDEEASVRGRGSYRGQKPASIRTRRPKAEDYDASEKTSEKYDSTGRRGGRPHTSDKQGTSRGDKFGTGEGANTGERVGTGETERTSGIFGSGSGASEESGLGEEPSPDRTADTGGKVIRGGALATDKGERTEGRPGSDMGPSTAREKRGDGSYDNGAGESAGGRFDTGAEASAEGRFDTGAEAGVEGGFDTSAEGSADGRFDTGKRAGAGKGTSAGRRNGADREPSRKAEARTGGRAGKGPSAGGARSDRGKVTDRGPSTAGGRGGTGRETGTSGIPGSVLEQGGDRKPKTEGRSAGRSGTSKGGPGTTKGTTRGGPGTTGGGPGATRGEPGTTGGGPGATRGEPGTTAGGPGATRGEPGITAGGSGASRGGPGSSRGGPGATRGESGTTRGEPIATEGGPGATRGEPGTTAGGPGATRGEPGTTAGGSGESRGGPGSTRGGPGATGGGPGATRGGPGTTAGGPGATRGEPGTTAGGPGATRGEPGTTGGGSGESRGGPGSTRGGPGASKGEPIATEGGPGATRGEPGTTAGGPGTTRGEPIATEGEPGATRGEPGTTAGGPGATRGEPGTTKGESGTTRGGPGTSEVEPGATRGGPGTTRGGPGTTRGGPGTTGEEPGAIRGEPGTTGGKLGTARKGQPGTIEERPGATGSKRTDGKRATAGDRGTGHGRRPSKDERSEDGKSGISSGVARQEPVTQGKSIDYTKEKPLTGGRQKGMAKPKSERAPIKHETVDQPVREKPAREPKDKDTEKAITPKVMPKKVAADSGSERVISVKDLKSTEGKVGGGYGMGDVTVATGSVPLKEKRGPSKKTSTKGEGKGVAKAIPEDKVPAGSRRGSAAGVSVKGSRGKPPSRGAIEKISAIRSQSSAKKKPSKSKNLGRGEDVPKKTSIFKKPKLLGKKKPSSDESEEDEEGEWEGVPRRGDGGGGPKGPRGPRGPRGPGGAGRRPAARRGAPGRKPHKMVRDVKSGSYIDYTIKSSGSEGPGISLEALTRGLKNKSGVLALLKGIEDAYNEQRNKIRKESMLRSLYSPGTSSDQMESSNYDISHPSLQKYDSIRRKLQSCGAFSEENTRDVYRRLLFDSSDDSAPLIKYIQPDLHKMRMKSTSVLGPRKSVLVKGSGKIGKEPLKQRIRSPLEKLRHEARKMHEDFKRTKLEETLDPTLLAEELAWNREKWRYSDLDKALKDQQVFQVMCRDCGGTGVDGLQLQYRFESVMDLCGGSSWPKEDPEKLKKIKNLRDTIKLSRGSKKQEEILKMLFSVMVEDNLALAKLPMAHTIPYIKYFMAMRCGFRMTQKIKDDMLREDMVAIDTLCIRGIKMYVPDEDEISPGCVNRYTWDSKKRLKKMSDKAQAQIRHDLRRALVDRVRLMWPICRNICVPTSTCHETFFALTGGREYDWLAFRPWNQGEYRDYQNVEKLCSCINQGEHA